MVSWWDTCSREDEQEEDKEKEEEEMEEGAEEMAYGPHACGIAISVEWGEVLAEFLSSCEYRQHSLEQVVQSSASYLHAVASRISLHDHGLHLAVA